MFILNSVQMFELSIYTSKGKTFCFLYGVVKMTESDLKPY